MRVVARSPQVYMGASRWPEHKPPASPSGFHAFLSGRQENAGNALNASLCWPRWPSNIVSSYRHLICVRSTTLVGPVTLCGVLATQTWPGRKVKRFSPCGGCKSVAALVALADWS